MKVSHSHPAVQFTREQNTKMPLFREVRQHPCRSYKSLITFAGYFSFGLFSGIFGPTLLDLRVKVQTDLKQLAFILPSKSFGSIIGTLISK